MLYFSIPLTADERRLAYLVMDIYLEMEGIGGRKDGDYSYDTAISLVGKLKDGIDDRDEPDATWPRSSTVHLSIAETGLLTEWVFGVNENCDVLLDKEDQILLKAMNDRFNPTTNNYQRMF